MRLIREKNPTQETPIWIVELTPLELEQLNQGETVEEPIMGDQRTTRDLVLRVQVKGQVKAAQ